MFARIRALSPLSMYARGLLVPNSHKIGWIPVDISEAWKAKQKEDYFFGSVDANRVQIATGRDITLFPKQDGPPLNYFVYPYVEVDGKQYDNLDKHFSFEEEKSSK
ncbi:MAG: hypothetical protein ABSE92_17340 [Terriglobales bacterium]|jgi:hypothetical protein